MPANAHASDHSLHEMKMDILFSKIHAHTQIIHFLPHEKNRYSFLRVEVPPS